MRHTCSISMANQLQTGEQPAQKLSMPQPFPYNPLLLTPEFAQKVAAARDRKMGTRMRAA